MRLVEADTEGPRDEDEEEGTTPPRPERRRVSRSLIFTLVVLTSIVVTIYKVFPKRHNELMSAVVAAHSEEIEFEITNPTRAELVAWSVALLGKDVPWPAHEANVKLVGLKSLRLVRRPAALVRYQISGERVSLLVQRPRDAVPRKHWRRVNGDLAISWRLKKGWTFTAIGPADTVDRWGTYLGAPGKLLAKGGSVDGGAAKK